MSIDAVCEGLDFIERNLKEPIAVADMADAVHLSLYYFCRVFNSFVCQTPYEYLIKRRLSESARELVETRQRITDIALEYRFGNLETFCRAFKRLFGQQPSQWRRDKSLDRKRLMPKLTPAHIHHFRRIRPLFPISEQHPIIHLAGLMSWIKDECSEIPVLWRRFSHVFSDIENQVTPRHFYGLAYDPIDGQEGYFYMASLQVYSPLCFHPLVVVKSLPAVTYARFIHNEQLADLPYTRDFIYHIWASKAGGSLAAGVEVHDYDGDLTVAIEGGRWAISVPLHPLPPLACQVKR